MQAAKGICDFRKIILGVDLPGRLLNQCRYLRRMAFRRFFVSQRVRRYHSLFRMIFPLMVLGSSSLNSTIRGYL